MAVFPNASFAVTVILNAVPAVALPGALTVSALADPGLTVTVPDVPVIADETISVALMVCDPAVFKVALKVPVPLVRVELPGNTACGSVPLKCTVPA